MYRSVFLIGEIEQMDVQLTWRVRLRALHESIVRRLPNVEDRPCFAR
jgi:hypothetical protein